MAGNLGWLLWMCLIALNFSNHLLVSSKHIHWYTHWWCRLWQIISSSATLILVNRWSVFVWRHFLNTVIGSTRKKIRITLSSLLALSHKCWVISGNLQYAKIAFLDANCFHSLISAIRRKKSTLFYLKDSTSSLKYVDVQHQREKLGICLLIKLISHVFLYEEER